MTQEVLRGRTTEERIECLEAEDVPCAPVLTRHEMIRHPQVVANALIVETEHPRAGRLRQSRTPAVFSATPTEHRRGAPGLGADTSEILAEAGYSAEEIAALLASGAAIEEAS
jgi:crotonobetainyl-CoA:carnitine CoA-transferase CaiB-like acyl-CoA transferase